MYKSPISIIDDTIEKMYLTLEKNLENEIIARAKMETDIDINAEELIKALSYDRDQYDNGYRDGYNAASKRYRDIIIDLYNKIVSDEEYFGSVVARSDSVEAREDGCRSNRRKPLKRR